MAKNIKISAILMMLLVSNILHFLIKYTINDLDTTLYFNKSSYFISALSDSRYAVLFFTVTLFFMFNYKNITWNKFSDKTALIVFIVIVSFPIFWEQFFYDYNYYLDSDFYIDKIAILFSVLLIFVHPLFSFFILFIGLTVRNSITFPLDYLHGNHWIDVRPVYDILILFVSFLILKSTRRFKDINSNVFIFLALTIHASNYFVPAIAKIEISPHGWEWTFIDNINNLFISSYVNGWLGFVNENTILKIARWMDSVDYLITIGTMCIQLGAIFLLYNRKITIYMFLLFEVLHFGIIFATGIVFMAWIVVNLGFLYLIKHLSNDSLKSLYNKNTFMLFMIVVFLSPLFYRPSVLGWWDSNINTVYDIYAIAQNGKEYKLNSQDLSPYDTVFAQNNLSYIDKQPTLVNNYGFLLKDLNYYSHSFLIILNNISGARLQSLIDSYKNDSFEVYEKLEHAKSIKEIREILKIYGYYNFDKPKLHELKLFLNKYFSNYNKKLKKEPLYKKLGAPYQLYDLSTKRVKGDIKIKHIKIIKSNVWYDKRHYEIKRFDKKILIDMDIK